MNYKIDIRKVFYDPFEYRPDEAREDQGFVERFFCSLTCAENYNEGATYEPEESPGEIEEYPDSIDKGTYCDWCHQSMTSR